MNFLPSSSGLRLAMVVAVLACILIMPSRILAHDFRVLVFSKSAGFRHDSIPAGIAAIQQLGVNHDFNVTATEDASQFNEANLQLFDAVIFLQTTGDVLNPAQEAALQGYIRAGGGFAGVHAASDTEYGWPWYRQLIGAYFSSHPAIQAGTVLALDRSHPSTRTLPERWTRTDEWYNFQANPRGNVHVLATLDETTYSGGTMGADHPISWCHNFEGGRSWYTALGHTSASYSDPLFLEHLLGGIEWAAGHAEGDAGGTVNASFEKLVLSSGVTDPMALDVAPDGRVFFVERNGKLKAYSPVTQATTLVGTISVFSGFEDGLLGLALDPAFAANGWIYLCYSPPGATPENILSRFTIANSTLVAGSEVVMLRVGTQRNECCHSGGGMEFGPDGDLYLSIGDNTNPFASDGFAPIDERAGRSAWDAQKASGSTNDLRGKVLRIRPQPNGTYTIPPGNLFAPGVPQTRAEIFAMGCRNPFRIAVDPFTGYLYWGDVGPDASADLSTRGPKGHDELNQARTAGNYGWPYFLANNLPYRDYNYATGGSGAAFNPAAPINNSPNNTGLTNLPAARGAFIWYPYGTSTAFPAIRTGSGRTMLAGDVYKYDPGLVSSVKFPAYFDRTLFVMEWSRNHLYEIKTDSAGNLLKIANFATTIPVKRPIDLTFGPDGAMYLIEWGSGFGGSNTDARIVKIIYNSNNKTPVAKAVADVTSGPLPLTVRFASTGSFDPDPGDTLSFAWDFDTNGTIDATAANPAYTYTAAGIFSAQLRVTDNNGLTGTTSVTISAGNTAPVVSFNWPPDGAFFDWGDEIAWDLRVDDAEDGSTVSGGITPSEVLFEVLLGHASHGHGISQTNEVKGAVIAENSHAFGDDLFLAFDASHADNGAPGVGPATGRRTQTLQPKCLQAEYHDSSSGTAVAATLDQATGGFDVTAADHGDSISFLPVNLLGIQQIGFRLASSVTGGRIEVRADAADGLLLAEAVVPNTGISAGSYRDVFVSITDPGGPRRLFIVFLRSPGDTDLCRLNWICFRGPGATKTARLPRVSQIKAGRPANGVTVVFDDIMDAASLAAVGNYSIPGMSIIGVSVDALLKSVILTCSSSFVPDQPYVLAITGVRDLAGDVISPGTRLPFKTQGNVLALNCGGPAFTGADGTSYLADQYFTGGSTTGNSNLISATSDDLIYQSERQGVFSYAIPLANGSYLATLKFVETTHTANNQRVFSVTLEGIPVVGNLDIHAQAGTNTAHDLTFQVTVTDGVLDIGFSATVSAATISGLVIDHSPATFSDFAGWQTFYFGSTTHADASPGSDPDGDGHDNALEYALGGDPEAADAAALAPIAFFTEAEPRKLSLRYRKAVPTLNYQVLWTGTLTPADWSETGVGIETYFPPTDSYQREVPVGPDEIRKFLRLRVGP